MIKLDLVNDVVNRTGITKTKAEIAVETVFDSMKKALAKGERIELRGFGVFNVKPRKTSNLGKSFSRFLKRSVFQFYVQPRGLSRKAVMNRSDVGVICLEKLISALACTRNNPKPFHQVLPLPANYFSVALTSG